MSNTLTRKFESHSLLKYRPDIDGLRALAVLAVVGYHAFPEWISGGYIGVDVFFVISGFLISTIIYGGLKHNNFSFVEFYSRRIRRIFPALLALLVACLVFGWVALLADEYSQLGKHIACGSGFVSNLILWSESGYFDNAAESKPLLHLWSLGIEEQFYILFPFILWAGFKSRFNPLYIVCTIAAFSFWENVIHYISNPVLAFYAPYTRFWELMVGSALACSILHYPKKIEAVEIKLDQWFKLLGCICPFLLSVFSRRDVQSILGILFIVTTGIYLSKDTAFPGWWALLPVLGSLLIVSAGADARANRLFLSNRILVWLGRISFPLYLWHWALLSFVRITENGTPSLTIRFATVLASLFLAAITYYWIELPLRFGNREKMKTVVLFLSMIVVGFAGYNIYSLNGYGFRYAQLEKNSAQFSWDEDQKYNKDCIKKFGFSVKDYCLIDDIAKDPEIVLLGDSNANHLFKGLNDATKGKNLLMLGYGACPPFLGVSTRIAEGERNCSKEMDSAFRYVVSTPSVKTIVLSMMGAPLLNGKRSLIDGGYIELHANRGDKTSDKNTLLKNSMRATLKFLVNAGKNVIFVVSTPRLNFSPKTCIDSRPLRLVSRATKSPCAIARKDFEEDSQKFREIVFSVLSEFPEVKVFDAAAELCDSQYCWAMNNGKLLYRDDVHLSLQGSEYLAAKLANKVGLTR